MCAFVFVFDCFIDIRLYIYMLVSSIFFHSFHFVRYRNRLSNKPANVQLFNWPWKYPCVVSGREPMEQYNNEYKESESEKRMENRMEQAGKKSGVRANKQAGRTNRRRKRRKKTSEPKAKQKNERYNQLMKMDWKHVVIFNWIKE